MQGRHQTAAVTTWCASPSGRVACSFVVGDKWSDVGLAQAVGARGILVRSGTGAAEIRRRADLVADVIVDNLAGAASWILMQLKLHGAGT